MASKRRKTNHETVSEKAMQYFDFAEEVMVGENLNTFYKCKQCHGKYNGNKPHNLAAHLQRAHLQIFDEIYDLKKSSIATKRLKLLQNIVEIVTVNGRPFKYIMDSGFKSIIQSKLDKLKAAGHGINLSNPNLPDVKQLLHEIGNEIRNKIKREVVGRALSLLVDIVTKNNRSIFGVSIQYIHNGKLFVRSIGMIELLQSHTAVYLADVICNRLKVYDIDLKQIITITTDNGSNMLKMIRDIDAILQQKILQNANDNVVEHTQNGSDGSLNSASSCDDKSSDIQIDEEISNVLLEADEETTDEQALAFLFDDVLLKDHENLLSAMNKQMVDSIGFDILWDITGVNCAAHTLQLAIKDALKRIARKHRNVIKLCRKVVKALRLKSIQQEIKTIGKQFRKPRLDVETRWCSLYLMVSFLLVINFKCT